jgi:hypothetical protein
MPKLSRLHLKAPSRIQSMKMRGGLAGYFLGWKTVLVPLFGGPKK